MTLPRLFDDRLSLPVIGAPMFTISYPELVIAQCAAGIVGAFPALNARPQEELERWIVRIESALAAQRAAHPASPIAPYAVNQIVHHTNSRLEQDLDVCVRHRVPIVITSLRSPETVVGRVHDYGGLVLHDVVNVRHAHKALEAGVDGLILVCAGAGGHGGTLSPFAFVDEVRRFYDGLLVLAGAITSGTSILAAQAMGCDLVYMGTRFIATREAQAAEAYKAMITGSTAADILYTPFFTGVHGNYLKPSIRNAGLDPDALSAGEGTRMDFARREARPWKNIWGAGQGVGNIREVLPVREVVARLADEYARARQRIA